MAGLDPAIQRNEESSGARSYAVATRRADPPSRERFGGTGWMAGSVAGHDE
ncbi:MAG: hypothetical protein WCA78_13115 [Rhizomicrobium sp.]|jgi:hypothetical protein